jgi:hypothetical protein
MSPYNDYEHPLAFATCSPLVSKTVSTDDYMFADRTRPSERFESPIREIQTMQPAKMGSVTFGKQARPNICLAAGPLSGSACFTGSCYPGIIKEKLSEGRREGRQLAIGANNQI